MGKWITGLQQYEGTREGSRHGKLMDLLMVIFHNRSREPCLFVKCGERGMMIRSSQQMGPCVHNGLGGLYFVFFSSASFFFLFSFSFCSLENVWIFKRFAGSINDLDFFFFFCQHKFDETMSFAACFILLSPSV